VRLMARFIEYHQGRELKSARVMREKIETRDGRGDS